jgi:hypothetical protein
MERTEKTAEELWHLIQSRLDALHDDDEVTAPLPLRKPRDAMGCNWTVETFTGPHVYRPAVRLIVSELQARFNLR